MSTILKSLRIISARKCSELGNKSFLSFHETPFKCNRPLSNLKGCLVTSTQIYPNYKPQATSNTIPLPLRSYAKRAAFKKEKKEKKAPTGGRKVSEEDLLTVVDLEEVRMQMGGCIDQLTTQLDTQLPLRLTLASLANIPVPTPDGNLPLSQLAQMQQKTASMIIVSLSERPELLTATKNAIIHAQVNITPQTEGTTMFLPVQKVTREHRETLAKSAKAIADKAKEKVRGVQARHERDMKKQQASEDILHQAKETLLQIAREHIEKVDVVLEKKQQQLLTS